MARIIGKGFTFDDVLIVPKYNKVVSRKNVNFKTRVTKRYYIDMPLVASNMDTICESQMAIAFGRMGGLGVIHRFLSIEEQIMEIRKVKECGLLSAAAVGIKDYEERVRALSSIGTEIIVLDVAHGHSKQVGRALGWIKENYPAIDVMVGNIATKDAAEYFISKGADAIKVGVGPGSLCTTRIMTGAGIPQLTAIMNAYEASQGRVPICADGGVKVPGDVVKAIGAGADTVMVGSIIAGTEETPGKIIEVGGEKFKEFRGMSSYDATVKRFELDGRKVEEVISVEGEKTIIKLNGRVEPILEKFLGGLASGMTYIGADFIDKLRGKADFFEISSAGRYESNAHKLLGDKIY
ncbi:MAG: guanosine monophosphate reductase [Nanoarchaeota archaeon]|nr:guanosine monophosphate reductase [Nanoarchaeota archaeon]